MGCSCLAKLAEVLGAKAGDQVIIEVQEGRRPVIEATIQGTITDYAGIAAYMEIGALQRIMREGGTMSGAHLAVDASAVDGISRRGEGSTAHRLARHQRCGAKDVSRKPPAR